MFKRNEKYLFSPGIQMKILTDSDCMMKLQRKGHPKILQERFRDVVCGETTGVDILTTN